jgi:hypothetical protein
LAINSDAFAVHSGISSSIYSTHMTEMKGELILLHAVTYSGYAPDMVKVRIGR